MNNGQFNIGSDANLTILVNGNPLGAAVLTSFEMKQVTQRAESIGADGRTRVRELEKGWDIDLAWDRADSLVYDYFVQKEADRYAGNAPQPVTLILRINNVDGSVSRYRFERVVLKLDSTGAYKGDDKVEQKVSGFASRMIAA